MLNDNEIAQLIRKKLDFSQKPIFEHLAGIISDEIVKRNISTADKLPAYRRLSWQINLSEGTVQRAYQELERKGLIITRVGDGSYVLKRQNERLESFSNAPKRKKISAIAPQTVIDLSRNQFLLHHNFDNWREILNFSSLSDRDMSRLFNYADERGGSSHRKAGLQLFSLLGISPKVEQIFCTNGAQHGVTIALHTLARRHDAIAVDAYTYPGIITLAKRMRIRLVVVDRDRDGMLPDALERQIQSHRIAGLYMMPNRHNPLNFSMSNSRRRDIADLCRKHNVMIIEDETQGLSGEQVFTSFFSLLPELTFVVSSVSKILNSGLRVGFLVAPQQLVNRARKVMRDSCWMATPMSHEIVKRSFETGLLDKSISSNKREIKRRKKLLQHLVADMDYTTQDCSPHYWIKLPKSSTDLEMYEKLLTDKIIVSPGAQFRVKQPQKEYFMRVCLTAYVDDAQLLFAFEKIRQTVSLAQQRCMKI